MSTLATTATLASSVGYVAEDLIVDRSLVLQVVYMVVCVAQLLSAWVMCVIYTTAYMRHHRLLDMVISWIILGLGIYILTGIANGVVYWKRWSNSPNIKRRKTVEQNKEAWMLLRLLLSLLGLAPVARYIESAVVIHNLLQLERTYMPVVEEQQRRQMNVSVISGGASHITAPTQPHTATTHGTSHPSLARGIAHVKQQQRQNSTPITPKMDEKAYRKVRQARRQMRRCQHDAAMVALISGFCGGAPMVVVQFIVLFFRDAEKYRDVLDIEYVFGILCLILSLLWCITSISHYYPATRMLPEADFDRGLGHRRGGLLLLFLARGATISARCLALATFPTICFYWIFLLLFGHWVLVFVMFMVNRWLDSRSSLEAGDQRSGWGAAVLDFLVYSWVSEFEFINGSTSRTRTRYLIHTALSYAEDIALVIAWFVVMPFTAAWYRLPVLLVVLILPPIGFLLMQIYFKVFHEVGLLKGTLSVCGLCHQRSPQEEEATRKYFHGTNAGGVPVASAAAAAGETMFGTNHTAQTARALRHPRQGQRTLEGAGSLSGTLSGMGDSLFFDSVSQRAGRVAPPPQQQRVAVSRNGPPHQRPPVPPQPISKGPPALPKTSVPPYSTSFSAPNTLKWQAPRLPPTTTQQQQQKNGGGPQKPVARLRQVPVVPTAHEYVNASYEKSDSDDSSSTSCDKDAVFQPKRPAQTTSGNRGPPRDTLV